MRRSKEELSGPAAEVELVPHSYFDRLELAEVFARLAPLEVDVGCGDGAHLVALAEQHPERNFLGLERMVGRVLTTCRKVAARKLSNVRVLRIESSYAVRYLLPAGSVEAFHVLFPDPWPKKRHHDRRLLNAEFLEAAHAALSVGGLLRIATDQADYFQEITGLTKENPLFVPRAPERDYPATTFEKHFQQQGLPIYRIELRKVS